MLDDYLLLDRDRIGIRYTGGDRAFAEETANALAEAILDLSDYFGLRQPFPRIRVVLVPNRDEFDRLVADLLGIEIEKPSHPGRMAQPQGTDLVVLSPSAYEQHSTYRYVPEEYGRLLFHEMTHMFEEYLAPAQAMETAPRWWSEGLAAYLSGQWKYEDQYGFRKPVLQGITEKTIPGIQEVQASLKLSYDWGWTIVMYIVHVHGKESILRIVRDCDDGEVFRMLGEDTRNFERKWQRWLVKDRAAIKSV